jgi:hypothetical protein
MNHYKACRRPVHFSARADEGDLNELPTAALKVYVTIAQTSIKRGPAADVWARVRQGLNQPSPQRASMPIVFRSLNQQCGHETQQALAAARYFCSATHRLRRGMSPPKRSNG